MRSILTTWRLAPPQSPIPWPFGMPKPRRLSTGIALPHRCWTSSDRPFFKWFVGGKTNIAHNALDRHVKSLGRKNKLAMIWEGEDGEQRTYSYFRLWKEVNRFANVLKSMGVEEGRPRHHLHGARAGTASIAMLASAKIGAIHSVIFGGFSDAGAC